MTTPDTYARKSTAEKWFIRAGNEWAFIFIDEDTGTFSTVGSFGNWGYSWTAIGPRTLKEFLAELEFDYFFGKVDTHHKGREFDAEATVLEAKKRIIEYRREGGDKFVARSAWRDLKDIQADTDQRFEHAFMTRMYDSPPICQIFGGDLYSGDRRHPQCEGFWTKIWPVFLEAIKPPAKAIAELYNGTLHDADPNCQHEISAAPGGGVKCDNCSGWFCY